MDVSVKGIEPKHSFITHTLENDIDTVFIEQDTELFILPINQTVNFSSDNNFAQNNSSSIKSPILLLVILLHVFLAFGLSISSSQKNKASAKALSPKKVSIIAASLHFNKPITITPIEHLRNNQPLKKEPITNELEKVIAPIKSLPTEAIKVKNNEQGVTKRVKMNKKNSQKPKQLSSTIVQSKTNKSIIKQSFSSQATSKLRAELDEEALVKSAEDYFNHIKAAQQTIPTSTNKFLPSINKENEIRFKNTNLDCSSNINQGMIMISNLLGGRIKCGVSPNLKEFLETRKNPH